MYLTELIFPSTSVILPNPSLQIHSKTLQTHEPSHYNFHIQSSALHVPHFLGFSTHIPTWILPYFAYSFNEIVSDFATILLWKPFLLNRLWIDFLQIVNGTDRLNLFIKERKYPFIEEKQTTQCQKEKKDKRTNIDRYKTKDRVTQTPLKTAGGI